MKALDPESFKNMGRSCACFNLRKAARSVTQLYDEFLRPSGLRATQFSLLIGAHVLQPVTLTRLARATVMDRTTLTRNLKVLEKQGLVALVQGEDRRERNVRVTEKGRRAIERGLPLWEQAQTKIVDGMGGERFGSLLGDLSSLIKLLRSM